MNPPPKKKPRWHLTLPVFLSDFSEKNNQDNLELLQPRCFPLWLRHFSKIVSNLSTKSQAQWKTLRSGASQIPLPTCTHFVQSGRTFLEEGSVQGFSTLCLTNNCRNLQKISSVPASEQLFLSLSGWSFVVFFQSSSGSFNVQLWLCTTRLIMCKKIC